MAKGLTFRLPFDAPAPASELRREPSVRACEVCGAPARHAFGHSERRGVEGRWFCAEHKSRGESAA